MTKPNMLLIGDERTIAIATLCYRFGLGDGKLGAPPRAYPGLGELLRLNGFALSAAYMIGMWQVYNSGYRMGQVEAAAHAKARAVMTLATPAGEVVTL